MRYYKLYKALFENREYYELSLISKVAYGVYVDMIENRYNAKKDENGKWYIYDARKCLMNELEISANTVTKIYKELIDAGLIEEVWQGFNISNKVYIKYYETIEFEQTNHLEPEYQEELNETFNTREFTGFEIKDSQELIIEEYGEFPFFEVGKILDNIDSYLYSQKDMKMIKMAVACMLDLYYEEDDYEEVIESIDEEILDKALIETKKSKDCRAKCSILADEIYKRTLQKVNS